MSLRPALLLVALLSLTACDMTSARYASDFSTKLSRNDLLILPANAEAYTEDAALNKTRKYDYESHVEPLLAEELEKELSEKGYRASVLPKAKLMVGKTYREYADFKEAMETSYLHTYKDGVAVSRDTAKNSVLHLNGSGKALGAKLKAPLLVYVNYDEVARTNDAQALDIATGVAMQLLVGTNTSAPPDHAKAVIAIVDSERDQVLWTNFGQSSGGGMVDGMIYTDDEQSLNHIRKSIAWALRELPKRDDLAKPAQ